MLNLRPIKARLAAATSRPWEWDLDVLRQKDSGALVLQSECEYGDDDLVVGSTIVAQMVDSDLIAHAPTDLAVLVAEVERLRSELDDAEARIERLLGALEAHQYYVAEVARLRALIIAHRDGCNCNETEWETPPRQCDVCFALYEVVEDA